MAWFKVDDQLHDHRKVRAAGKSAMGVWVLAGSWCSERENDGFVPESVLNRWGNRADAAKLVAAGLWTAGEREGEQGWQFHDWTIFQPDAATLRAVRAKESTAGALGNHKRWHVTRGVAVPDCEYCHQVPDREPDGDPDRVSVGLGIGSSSPVPVPDPEPHVSPNGETTTGALVLASRDDINRICDHLADRIADDGSKRPAITKGWTDAARLMLDKDERSEDEIHAAIDWCQTHPFWRTNVLSMPKLREKFDQLRKVAVAEQQQRPRQGSRTEEWKAMQERQMARAEQREREMGLRP